MTATTNAENLLQYKVRFSLIVEQIIAFASSPKMFREVKDLSPNFKQIAWRCFTLFNILVWIVRSMLSLNPNSSTKSSFQIACV